MTRSRYLPGLVQAIHGALSPRRARRSLPSAFGVGLLLLWAATPAWAALDAELKNPYQIEVVLHVADNRALTPLFQEQLERALGDQLRQTFGALAQVEVKRRHALLAQVLARGLEPALDAWEGTSSVQTHFILLDYAGGEYRLQARVYDGMTGQAGVAVGRVQTGDRALVARLATRLVEQEFALVGTVTPAGKSVSLTLKGGGLGVPLDRWVNIGDVFAVSRVTTQGAAPHAARVAWALLEVQGPPRDGVCRCRYWHRFREDDLSARTGVLGYRALKLPTARAPVRLQLRDAQTDQPLDGIPVEVAHPGTGEKVKLTTNRDGLVTTQASFAQMVIAQLPGVQLPIEVIAGRTAVCRVKLRDGSDTVAALEYRRDAWLRRVYENLQRSALRARELNRELTKSLDAAEATAQEGLTNLRTELSELALEHNELKALMQKGQFSAKQFDLREGEQRLGELRVREKELQKFVVRIQEARKEGQKNALLSQKVERARLLEAEAAYGPAIALYEKVLEESPDQPKVRAHLDQLRQDWAIKNTKHAEARAFVYDTWPKLDIAGLKKNLDTAHQALATFKAVGDRLTPKKMLLADAGHAVLLTKELDRLRQKATEDNRNQAKVIAQVATGLRQLHQEIVAFVGASKE